MDLDFIKSVYILGRFRNSQRLNKKLFAHTHLVLKALLCYNSNFVFKCKTSIYITYYNIFIFTYEVLLIFSFIP